MAFKCGECGWQVESREYTAVEVHKLNHIINGLADGLKALGLVPTANDRTSS